MSARQAPAVQFIDSWGKRPVYRARIVNSGLAGIVVKSARNLSVGQRISFATLADLATRPNLCSRRQEEWRSAVIWRIEKNCLHLTRT